MLRFWNTLHRRLEPFAPLNPGRVGLYTCGPTVYDRATIGNLRTYLFEDVLVRTLLFLNYQVTHVMNITDVGHLVGDGDVGEDKVEREAIKKGKTAWEIARACEALFFEDVKQLNILPPTHAPRATEHIQEQIALIQALERRGLTYQTSDGMYFDTKKWPAYGKLSGQKLEDKEAGARVEVNTEKHQPTDFALWKFSPNDQKRQMEWESPWGSGFPGWHIECSAMSIKYLGQPFDIHCGGVDHIPVHHENEIAQSEAAADGQILARYWLHGEFLLIDGGRMGKSLGNGYTTDDLKAQGFDPLTFRYFCLGAHYRSKLNFTWEALQGAQNALEKLKRWVETYKVSGSEALAEPDALALQAFQAALEDDLNTPKALAVVHKLLQTAPTQETAPVVYATFLRMDQVLGFGMVDWKTEVRAIPAAIQALLEARARAREAKQWAESDRLRDELHTQGWLVEDHNGAASTVRFLGKS